MQKGVAIALVAFVIGIALDASNWFIDKDNPKESKSNIEYAFISFKDDCRFNNFRNLDYLEKGQKYILKRDKEDRTIEGITSPLNEKATIRTRDFFNNYLYRTVLVEKNITLSYDALFDEIKLKNPSLLVTEQFSGKPHLTIYYNHQNGGDCERGSFRIFKSYGKWYFEQVVREENDYGGYDRTMKRFQVKKNCFERLIELEKTLADHTKAKTSDESIALVDFIIETGKRTYKCKIDSLDFLNELSKAIQENKIEEKVLLRYN